MYIFTNSQDQVGFYLGVDMNMCYYFYC